MKAENSQFSMKKIFYLNSETTKKISNIVNYETKKP